VGNTLVDKHAIWDYAKNVRLFIANLNTALVEALQ